MQVFLHEDKRVPVRISTERSGHLRQEGFETIKFGIRYITVTVRIR